MQQVIERYNLHSNNLSKMGQPPLELQVRYIFFCRWIISLLMLAFHHVSQDKWTNIFKAQRLQTLHVSFLGWIKIELIRKRRREEAKRIKGKGENSRQSHPTFTYRMLRIINNHLAWSSGVSELLVCYRSMSHMNEGWNFSFFFFSSLSQAHSIKCSRTSELLQFLLNRLISVFY